MKKFYNRRRELELLATIADQSHRQACFTMLIGRRRIGKTSLLLRSVQGTRYLYLFVSRRSESLLCEQFQQEIAEVLGLQIYGRPTNFKVLFEELLRFSEKEHLTLILDEFQEFDTVNRSIFGDIQNLWDRYKDRIKMNLIVCGSIYSLMKKIFENNKEPLFGRLSSKIVLKPFDISTIQEILRDNNPAFSNQDLFTLYLITGGVAKYIDLLIEAGAVTHDAMIEYVVRLDSPFLVEGRDLLISEFGREYTIYFSILQLIASGHTAQNEIDSIIGKNTGAYLNNLEHEFSLISRRRPLFARPESRSARFVLNDNYLMFWFRFVFRNISMVELGKNDLLLSYIRQHYEQYSGALLERFFRDKMVEEMSITEIGGYWDRKGENEIDIIALNSLTKKAWIVEVKRNKQKINPEALIRKGECLSKELSGYQIKHCGLSMEDVAGSILPQMSPD